MDNVEEMERRLATTPGKELYAIVFELSSHYRTHPADKAIEYCEQAIAAAVEKNDGIAETEALNASGLIYYYSGDVDTAVERLTESLGKSETIEYRTGIADSCFFLGHIFNARGDYGNALEYYKRSLAVCEEIGEKPSLARAANNIGIIYKKLSQYDMALEFYFKALDIRQEFDDGEATANTLSNIAVIYDYMREFDKALEYHQRSLAVREEIGDDYRTSASLLNIGAHYSTVEDIEKALEYYEKALAIKEKIDDRTGIAYILNNIGLAHKDRGDYDEALKNLLGSLEIKEKLGDKRGIAASSINIGEVYMKIGNYDKAESFLQQSLDYAKEIGSRALARDANHAFCDLNTLTGDFEKALEFFKSYSDIKDEIFDEETGNKIAEMQTVYETAQKEKEAEIYRLKNVELAEAIAQLEETERVLEEYRDRLEEKVEQRARELQEANVSLEKEVNIRVSAENALKESYERLQETMDGIVLTMVKLVETRDPYTAGHQQRVSKLATAIARELGLSDDRIACVETSAILHDIGKIYVPSEILTKPGKLTDLEFMLIKNHALTGFEILKSIRFPWPVAQIVLQHHERLDGSGYPNGLKGGDICIEALIIAVADVVEAMASHRPYRPSLGLDVALGEINGGIGNRYDGEVAKACMSVFAGDFAF